MAKFISVWQTLPRNVHARIVRAIYLCVFILKRAYFNLKIHIYIPLFEMRFMSLQLQSLATHVSNM